jgi:hypothetical protein
LAFFVIARTVVLSGRILAGRRTAPEVVDWATVRSAFSPVERFLVPRFGITQYVRLQHAHNQA